MRAILLAWEGVMDIVLLVLALALTGAAAGIWMWLRTRRIAAGLHRRNAGLVSAEVEDALVWAISRTAGGPGGHP